MSTHAIGFKPADEKWKKMKAVWESCEQAGIDIPDDVYDYFDGEAPGDKPGMEVELGESCQEWSDDYRGGYEINVDKLPDGVKYIRVYNSW